MSDSLQPHGLQHARCPCSSPNPTVCSNSCPTSWCCSPTIILCRPLPLPPSVFPSIRVFSNESLLHINGHSTGVSASASVLPMNIQNWSPLGLSGLILQSKTLKSLLQHHSLKPSIILHSAFCMVQLSHPYTTTRKIKCNSPGQNTGVGSLSLLQGIFPTQELNPGLPHCRRILYQLRQKGRP